jgi:hypothetical protein
MEDYKINTFIFEQLEKIAPIATARVSMFSIDDRYSYIPYCRFRFKNRNKDDEIYRKIRNAVDSFEGNCKWAVIPGTATENYLLVPIISPESKMIWSDKNYFISLFGESYYKTKIDESINDILKLGLHISRYCQENNMI